MNFMWWMKDEAPRSQLEANDRCLPELPGSKHPKYSWAQLWHRTSHETMWKRAREWSGNFQSIHQNCLESHHSFSVATGCSQVGEINVYAKDFAEITLEKKVPKMLLQNKSPIHVGDVCWDNSRNNRKGKRKTFYCSNGVVEISLGTELTEKSLDLGYFSFIFLSSSVLHVRGA